MRFLFWLMGPFFISVALGAAEIDLNELCVKGLTALLEKRNDPEAVPCLKEAAKQGHTGAQFLLYSLHRQGLYVSKDIHFLKNIPKAYRLLNSMEKQHDKIMKDFPCVVEYLKKFDQNAFAQSALGRLYSEGWGVKKDNAEARKWLQRAVDQDDAAAQCSLGFMYTVGEGVIKDYAEAVKYSRRAANQGDARAQINLGLLYENKNDKKAVKYFRRAAKQGHSDALRSLGVMYRNGQGVVKKSSRRRF